VNVPPSQRPQGFGCTFIAIPLLLVALGMMFVTAGRQLRPRDEAAAAVFRTDPSCTADLRASVTPGACATVDATVLSAEMRVSGMGKTRVHTPLVSVRFEDGTIHDGELDGGARNVFVYTVRSGARARAQTFRGTLVRVTAGDDSAETVSAPDVAAETTRELPWVGAVAMIAAVLIVIARMLVLRRAR
jgi:hypothetical protein